MPVRWRFGSNNSPHYPFILSDLEGRAASAAQGISTSLDTNGLGFDDNPAYGNRMTKSNPRTAARSKARAAARLAAVQALYQHDMEQTPLAQLLHEFHNHRLGAEIEDAQYAEADVDFFDDVVKGVLARGGEIDATIAGKLATGWTLERLDKPMKAILRCGTYELLARADVPTGAVITEYVDVAHAFYDKRESGFVNGLLDAISKVVRAS